MSAVQLVSDQDLHQALLELELIDTSQLSDAYERSKQLDESSFIDVLLDRNLISDENLGKLLADLHGVPYVDFRRVKLEDATFLLIPEEMARAQETIAYQETDDAVFVATSQPTNVQAIEFIKKKTGKPVKVRYTTPRNIRDALGRYKQDLSTKFSNLIDNYIKQAERARGRSEVEPPITKMVDTLFDYSYVSKASDIHLEPEEETTFVRFRIDGILQEMVTIPNSLHSQVVTRIKVLAQLRTDEHQSAQDGKLEFKSEGQSIDVRVSVVPTTHGERVVMRLLSEQSRNFSLEDLGLQNDDLEKVQEAYKRPHGMVLVTGPTGSGKTTSLYAVVKLLNTRDINIMTIEDPVEYDIEGVSQIQVNVKTNLTFAEGLKSIVRQDPDVILIGEIRDEETASIAVNSAMTGHLVLSTLHTNDAATTIPRLLDMNIEPFLVASSVNVIVAQRLVRRICLRCRVSKEVSIKKVLETEQAFQKRAEQEEKETSVANLLSQDMIHKHLGTGDTIRLYEGKGCEVCHHTGYTGRVGIFEVMLVSDLIRDAIVRSADASDIAKLALQEGMTPMIEDGLEKVRSGVTTIDEVLRVTKE